MNLETFKYGIMIAVIVLIAISLFLALVWKMGEASLQKKWNKQKQS